MDDASGGYFRSPHDPIELTPGRMLLRELLRGFVERLGTPGAALEVLVMRATLMPWRAGRVILAADDSPDVVHVLVHGAARLTSRTPAGKPVTVRFIPPGEVMRLPTGRGEGSPALAVRAHLPSLVAALDVQTLGRVAERVAGERLVRSVLDLWRRSGELVAQKAGLPALSVRARLRHELGILARDFGVPRECGTLVDLPLTHGDLAQLVVASRANVTRALVKLRRERLVAVVDRRLLLARPSPDADRT